jgi:hypothetical protein
LSAISGAPGGPTGDAQEVIVKLFTAHCITEAPRLMILDSQGTTVVENARGGTHAGHGLD